MDIKISSSTVVCFDLDDTLYNEMDYLRSAYKEIAAFLEPSANKELFAKMFSLYRKKENVFDFLNKEYGIDKEKLLTSYREHLPSIRPFPGVLDLIKNIKRKHGRLAVITDGRSISQRNKLKALGLADYLDEIIVSEEIGSEKPDPNNFRCIAEKYPNGAYIYIGDNFKKDFIAPNALGWLTIGLIDNGKNVHNNTFNYFNGQNAPDQIIFELADINVN